MVYGPVHPSQGAPTKFFSRRTLTRHHLKLGLCLVVVPQATMVELNFCLDQYASGRDGDT